MRPERQADRTTPLRGRLPGWVLFLGLGTLLVGVYFVLPDEIKNFGFDFFGLYAVGGILFGVRKYRPTNRVAWYAMALGQFLFVVGDLIWTIYEEVLHRESPFPSVADVAYLAGYIPLLIGLILVVRARQPGLDVPSLLDAAVITVAASVASWVFLIAPQAADPDLTMTGRIVSIAYPAVDLLLVAVTARLLLASHARVPSLHFIGASLVGLLAADAWYTLASLNGTYATGDLLDAGWLLSYVLWGTAALHPSMRALTEPGPTEEPTRLTRGRLVTLGTAALAIPVMQAIQVVRGEPLYVPIEVTGTMVAFVLVMLRMSGLATALRSAALHDDLTNLPNRRLLADRLRHAMSRMERTGLPVAVLFLDLGHFKVVNDSLGHEAGDEALIEVGRRIQTCVRASDTVARFGGDEFVVVCEGLDEGHAETIAQRLTETVTAPIWIRGVPVYLSIDIGIALGDPAGETGAEDLLQVADRAMYQAKEQGRNPRNGNETPIGAGSGE